MTRAAVVALLALLAAVGGGWEAHACTCSSLTPAAALRGSDIAFTGLVTAVVDGPTTSDPRTVTFDVDEVYKGRVREVATVETPRDADDCGIDFVASERYTVFAESEDGRVTSDVCDATSADAELLAGVATPRPPGALAMPPPEADGRGGFPYLSLVLVIAGAAAITAWRRRARAAR